MATRHLHGNVPEEILKGVRPVGNADGDDRNAHGFLIDCSPLVAHAYAGCYAGVADLDGGADTACTAGGQCVDGKNKTGGTSRAAKICTAPHFTGYRSRRRFWQLEVHSRLLLGKDGDISTFRLLHNAAATFIQDCNSVNRSELSHFLCELYAGNFTTVFSAQQIMGF